MRRGRRKDLYKRERDSLKGLHDEAEIQRKALRRGKNLAFSEDICLEKVSVRSKRIPRKVGVGLKRGREPSRRRLGWWFALWEPTEKKETSHLIGLRGRHQYSDQRSNRNRATCVASTAVRTKGRRTKWPDRQHKESSRREIIIEERKKVQGQERILAEHLEGLERNDFCDFEKPRKRAYQKGKIESNEQSKEGGQPK